MTNSATQHPFSFGRAFAAYCLAVTAATFSFTLAFGVPWGPAGQMLVLFGVEWVVAFITSVVPFAIAIVVARRFSIMRWWYFAGGGLLTAALLCLPHAWEAREGPPLGPVPDPIPSLAESYIRFAPSFWLSGVAAGVVCWWFLCRGRSHREHDAQPCGQPDLAHKAAQGRLP